MQLLTNIVQTYNKVSVTGYSGIYSTLTTLFIGSMRIAEQFIPKKKLFKRSRCDGRKFVFANRVVEQQNFSSDCSVKCTNSNKTCISTEKELETCIHSMIHCQCGE